MSLKDLIDGKLDAMPKPVDIEAERHENLKAIILEMRHEMSERLDVIEIIAKSTHESNLSLIAIVSDIRREIEFTQEFSRVMRKYAKEAYDNEQERGL